jgi:hypothetical protein
MFPECSQANSGDSQWLTNTLHLLRVLCRYAAFRTKTGEAVRDPILIAGRLLALDLLHTLLQGLAPLSARWRGGEGGGGLAAPMVRRPSHTKLTHTHKE